MEPIEASKTDHFSIRYLSANEQGDYDRLFRRCFGHEPTPGLWDFKFSPSSGYSLGLFESHGGAQSPELIAHYGGVKRPIVYFGQLQLAIQISDIMVSASGVKSLTKKGPFFWVATTFLENHIGYERQALIAFGFPNLRSMKIGALLGLYKEVERIKEIEWSAKTYSLPFWCECIELNAAQQGLAHSWIEQLWSGMRFDLKDAIVGVRDAQYIFHRYFKRPQKDYRLMLIKNRLNGKPKGLMVFQQDANRFELIDLVAPLSNMPGLIRYARELATAHASRVLLLRITSSFVKHLMTQDAKVNAIDISIPANVWTPGPSSDTLLNQWWLMSGDMDYV